jgi:hypothetical protein
MTREEQETIFRFDAEKREVSIFTAYPSAKLKIERQGYPPWKVSRDDGRAVGWFYKIPYAEFKWRVTGPGKARRPLTAEQREKMVERGRTLARTLASDRTLVGA